jgi:spermidine synthase
VLGAGDGMLLRELLRYPEIKNITLIELDPFMIDLALNHEYFVRYNRSSLMDPRVHVIIDDAYSFLRQTQEKYDGAFVDFPFPNNYELSKLFSREFYGLLRSALTGDGFAVLDAPIVRFEESSDSVVHPRPQDIVVSTLKSAGFPSLLFYGPVEPFVFVSMRERELRFNYEKLPSFVENRVLLNLTNLNHVLTAADIREENVNTLYKPKRFR